MVDDGDDKYSNNYIKSASVLRLGERLCPNIQDVVGIGCISVLIDLTGVTDNNE